MTSRSATNITIPVTLNLFQGPSGRKYSVIRSGGMAASFRAAQSIGRGAKWTLKQVQGDEKVSRTAMRG